MNLTQVLHSRILVTNPLPVERNPITVVPVRPLDALTTKNAYCHTHTHNEDPENSTSRCLPAPPPPPR